MSEAKPQDGSTVKGYRSLTQTETGAMNDIKSISRKFLAELDMLATNGEYDKRWLAIARTDMQTACMAACRAVARPDNES
ncbi:Acb2/Tad1 domain-containing protein [Klebsiella pneumoniae]|uniref:Acb2/Tad1 domain-containing protein n=1 Tax=Klebsiella pneumoniae TaxID=573 RepID=UPI00309989A7